MNFFDGQYNKNVQNAYVWWYSLATNHNKSMDAIDVNFDSFDKDMYGTQAFDAKHIVIAMPFHLKNYLLKYAFWWVLNTKSM